MNRLRLLPILLFALICLFAMKMLDIVRGDMFSGPPAALAQAVVPGEVGPGHVAVNTQPDAPDITGSIAGAPDASSADATPSAAQGTAVADGSSPSAAASSGTPPATTLAPADPAAPSPPVATADSLLSSDSASPAERAILERLQQRREQLDQQARELDMRENLLNAAEKRIEDRIAELKQLQASVGTAQQQKTDAQDARVKNVVIMYEAMKPKDAARIFDKLDPAVLLDVAIAMKPTKLSDVIASMDPDAAQRLTVALASHTDTKPADGVVQPALDLPKIQGTQPNG